MATCANCKQEISSTIVEGPTRIARYSMGVGFRGAIEKLRIIVQFRCRCSQWEERRFQERLTLR
jgi:hypothetical protein